MRLILAEGRTPASDEKVIDFLRMAIERKIDLTRMCVAEANGQLLWAILPVYSPGRTALLLAPREAPDGHRESAARELIAYTLKKLASTGVQLGQVLLDPADRTARRLFVASGFEQLAELVYLQRLVRSTWEYPALANGRLWLHYNQSTHAVFGQTILQSYIHSLDCPALNGKRHIDDILAGHLAAGEHDPSLWFALVENDAPLGVLILSHAVQTDSMELVYLGVPHLARGQGIGNLLMQQALATVADRNVSRLTLAVDSRNTPGLQLYHRHGMHRVANRFALLRDVTRLTR